MAAPNKQSANRSYADSDDDERMDEEVTEQTPAPAGDLPAPSPTPATLTPQRASSSIFVTPPRRASPVRQDQSSNEFRSPVRQASSMRRDTTPTRPSPLHQVHTATDLMATLVQNPREFLRQQQGQRWFPAPVAQTPIEDEQNPPLLDTETMSPLTEYGLPTAHNSAGARQPAARTIDDEILERSRAHLLRQARWTVDNMLLRSQMMDTTEDAFIPARSAEPRPSQPRTPQRQIMRTSYAQQGTVPSALNLPRTPSPRQLRLPPRLSPSNRPQGDIQGQTQRQRPAARYPKYPNYPNYPFNRPLSQSRLDTINPSILDIACNSSVPTISSDDFNATIDIQPAMPSLPATLQRTDGGPRLATCNLCQNVFVQGNDTIRPDLEGREYCADCIRRVGNKVVEDQKTKFERDE
jgi:hypothetical protein